MKNLDILANAIRADNENATPATPTAFTLSDNDVNRIANRMIEIMSNKTDSVVDSGSQNTETETNENADESAREETENNGCNDGESRAVD